MNTPDDIFAELEQSVAQVAGKYVNAYVTKVTTGSTEKFVAKDPMLSPDDYDLDVRAYCVLSHAGIEHFVESISQSISEAAIKAWLKPNGKPSNTLIALVAYYGEKLKVEDDDSNSTTTYFDNLRDVITRIKVKLSRDIHENHGASLKYLRKLLYPVAIDIPRDTSRIASLERLARERGSYAHKLAATRSIAPEDAISLVGDCIELCKDIRDKAKRRSSEFT